LLEFLFLIACAATLGTVADTGRRSGSSHRGTQQPSSLLASLFFFGRVKTGRDTEPAGENL
jgi:hypothetical protein